MNPLPDIQKTEDTRRVAIEHVGVTGVRMPLVVLTRPSPVRELLSVPLQTVGSFELSVSLPEHVKGTHMSRFTEVLNEHISAVGVFSAQHLTTIAQTLITRLDATRARLRLDLDYFVVQNAPTSGRPGTAPLRAFLEVDVVDLPCQGGRVTDLLVGVEIDGKTCCPCSREISDYDHETGKGRGAHAQRSKVTIRVRPAEGKMVWFEDLVDVAWKSFSSPIYPVLKRPDERTVTVGAYTNPKFVEDVIRDVVVGLRSLPTVKEYSVRVQNAESIHYHDAFAEVSTLSS
jgi:GTP cyclohydrolase I